MKPDWLGVNECTYLGGAHGASAEVNERLLNWRVEGGLQGTLLVVEVWQMLNLASHRHHLQREENFRKFECLWVELCHSKISHKT